MKSPPFFIPKIMKNTSGNGPETIPVFVTFFLIFHDFYLLLEALFGQNGVGQFSFGGPFSVFLRCLFLLLFLAGIFVVRGSSGGAPDRFWELRSRPGPHFPPFLSILGLFLVILR